MGSGGGLTGKMQRGHVGGAAQEAAQLVKCALGEVRVRGNGLGKGQVVRGGGTTSGGRGVPTAQR